MARQLADWFRSPVLHISVDTYFKKGAKALCCYDDRRRCAEMPESVESNVCAAHLKRLVEVLSAADHVPSADWFRECPDREGVTGKSLKSDRAVVVVEGFVLLAEPCLVDICDHIVFIDSDEDTCCRRRFGRKAHTGKDVDREYAAFQQEYSHVYRHHRDLRPRFCEVMHGLSCVVVDGRGKEQEVFDAALHGLQLAMAEPQPWQGQLDPDAPDLVRSHSDEFGVGASNYDRETLERWMALAQTGGEALKRAKKIPSEKRCLAYREAVDAFEQAIALRPDFQKCHQGLSMALKGIAANTEA